MLRQLIIVSALLVGACSTPTMYSETADEIRIHFGGGGLLKGKMDVYRKIQQTGKRIVIDGQVVSADAFFAFSLPNACYTENAVFSPHSASYMGVVPAPELTRDLAYRLPAPLRDWFKGNFAYHDWVGFAYVDYNQLLKIWPDGACPEAEDVAGSRLAAAHRPRPISMNR